MYPTCAVTHCITSPSDITKTIPVIAEQAWALYGYLQWRGTTHRTGTIQKRPDGPECRVSSRRQALLSNTRACEACTSLFADYLGRVENDHVVEEVSRLGRIPQFAECAQGDEDGIVVTGVDDGGVDEVYMVGRAVEVHDNTEHIDTMVRRLRSLRRATSWRSSDNTTYQSTTMTVASGISTGGGKVGSTLLTPPQSPSSEKQRDILISRHMPDVTTTRNVYNIIQRVVTDGVVLGSLIAVDKLLKSWLSTFTPLLPSTAQTRNKFKRLCRTYQSASALEHRARVSALVTLFMVIHTIMQSLKRARNCHMHDQRDCHKNDDNTTLPGARCSSRLVGDTTQSYDMPVIFKEFRLEVYCSGNEAVCDVEQWEIGGMHIFFDSYAAYVDLDVFAMVCCIRVFPQALERCLAMACKDADIMALNNPFAPVGTTDKVNHAPSVGTTPPKPVTEEAALLFQSCLVENKVPSTLCVLLAYLHPLYQASPSQAISLCASLYPYIGPWNVICILLGDGGVTSGQSLQSPQQQQQASACPTHYWANTEWLDFPTICPTEDAQLMWCSYLLRIVGCRCVEGMELRCEDIKLVHALLDSCLRVHEAMTSRIITEIGFRAVSGSKVSSDGLMYSTQIADIAATHSILLDPPPGQHHCDNQLLTIVHNVITRPDLFAYDVTIVASMCVKCAFPEGAIEVLRLVLQRAGGVYSQCGNNVPSLPPLCINDSGDIYHTKLRQDAATGVEMWDCAGTVDVDWAEEILGDVLEALAECLPSSSGLLENLTDMEVYQGGYVGEMYRKAYRLLWLLHCMDMNGPTCQEEGGNDVMMSTMQDRIRRCGIFIDRSGVMGSAGREFVEACLSKSLGQDLAEAILSCIPCS